MVLNDPLKPQTPMITSSRLSKTFHEVLHDKDALPYLREFMKSQNAEHIIQFWLDAESFQASSWTCIRSQSVKSQNRNNNSKETAGNVSANDGSPKESGTPSGSAVTDCANCDKEGKEGENAKSNSCDKGEGHSVQTGGAEVTGTSQGAINGKSTEPAGQVGNVPSNHSNAPDTVNNQSDGSKRSSASPTEMTATGCIQSNISQSSQIKPNSDSHSTSSSDKTGLPQQQSGSSDLQAPQGSSPMRPKPSASPVHTGSSSASPQHVKSPPRSPTADKISDNSFQLKLKKSKSFNRFKARSHTAIAIVKAMSLK